LLPTRPSRVDVQGMISLMNSMQKVVTRKRKGDDDSAWRFWLTRPASERIAMVEELRAEYHGWTNESEPRLSRVCRIIRRP
jgi:hypothetical protein